MKRVIKQKMEDGSLQIIHQNFGVSSDSENAIPAPYNTEEIITESGEWEAPVDGWYEVTVIGGGQGAYSFVTNKGRIIRTGASGIWKKRLVYLTKSQEVPVVIGAGGKGKFSDTSYLISDLNATYGGCTYFGELETGDNDFYFASLQMDISTASYYDEIVISTYQAFYGAGGNARIVSTVTSLTYADDGKSGAVIIRYYDYRKDTSLSIGDQLVTDLYARLAALEAKVDG